MVPDYLKWANETSSRDKFIFRGFLIIFYFGLLTFSASQHLMNRIVQLERENGAIVLFG
jgi:hypothetical protein